MRRSWAFFLVSLALGAQDVTYDRLVNALKEQQKIDLERSFEYARKKLNVGINWRG